MKRHDLTLLSLTTGMGLFAFGCIRLTVGIILDEITIARLQRDLRARGPANRDAREVGRTTSDDGGVW